MIRTTINDFGIWNCRRNEWIDDLRMSRALLSVCGSEVGGRAGQESGLVIIVFIIVEALERCVAPGFCLNNIWYRTCDALVNQYIGIDLVSV